jgi:hypothetical protein
MPSTAPIPGQWFGSKIAKVSRLSPQQAENAKYRGFNSRYL